MNEFALIPGTLPASLNAYPAHPQQFMEILAQYLTVQFSQSFALFNYGEATPPVDKQDRPWIRTIGGKPAGIWIFYSGQWVRDWGVPLGAQIPIQNMSLAAFDGTGKATDPGFVGWALCNGQNGTDDIRDKFILGYKDGTRVSPGGAEEVVLIPANLPLHSHDALGSTESDSGGANTKFRGTTVDTDGEPVTLSTEDAGSATPTAVKIMPPYIIKAIIQFIGV